MFEALDKFVGFFHNRDIGRKIRVEHCLKTEAPENCVELTCHVGAGFKPELLTYRDANRRCNLRHTKVFICAKQVRNVMRLVVLDDCPPSGNAQNTGRT